MWAKKALQQPAGVSDMRRTLGLGDLLVLGIGGIVGTGVFVLTGRAAADHAGPAVMLSFVLGALAAGLAALCYAEMASMTTAAGSAYLYAYATLGELFAFIIGWILILEYGVAAATVAGGWSGYMVGVGERLTGVQAEPRWLSAPFAFAAHSSTFSATSGLLNAPATFIVLAVTVMLCRGMGLSMRLLRLVVGLKLVVIVLFICACLPRLSVANWQPFMPANTGHFGHFGPSGIMQGATLLFFAYGGFDAVSTAAQECRRPQRDVPLGILISLATATLLYVAVAAALTGVVPYTQLGVSNPLAVGMRAAGYPTLQVLVELGAITGLSAVLTVGIYGQTRILYAMARDGLLPFSLARLHPAHGTPVALTAWVGGAVALAAGLLPLEFLGELTSVGTLLAFMLVALGVMVLRRQQPHAPRAFRVPGGDYLLPLLSLSVSGLLLGTATGASLVRLGIWVALGLLAYAFVLIRTPRPG